MPVRWDAEVDVVVAGSGAAALVAATLAADGGAEVALVEKSAGVGGTTAVSGGGIWVPGNHHMAAAGLADDPAAAAAYIRRLAAGTEPDPGLVEVFVATAPAALAYLEAQTPLRTAMVPVGDYYLPYGVDGAAASGRQVEPVPFAFGAELPDWCDRVARRTTMASMGARTTMAEEVTGGAATMADELDRRERDDVRTKGAALVGMLLRGLLARGVAVHRRRAVRELVAVDGAVMGARMEDGDRSVLVAARQGVVLACGGFEWDADLVRTFLGYDVQPLTPAGNTGDGLRMAAEAGARLANMTGFWGHGALVDPDGPHATFDAGRGMPGTIVVDRRGDRFVNEAEPYHDFAADVGRHDAGAAFPDRPAAWLVFDEATRRSVPTLAGRPTGPGPHGDAAAATVEELAGLIGADPARLAATVDRFDAGAAAGVDPDFHRHDRGLVVAVPPRPLGPGPFYAAAVFSGTLGTSGGPTVDRDGRVVDWEGRPVPGLYAAGNTAASIFGHAYPSGGTTLGNAMVTGYLAGRHVAASPRRAV
ncbi:MAG TPA: FAD-binding protein [Acidimicrobiales bacterium]|nr:FAD-binding protein [Acidimicrobiales bacterium]